MPIKHFLLMGTLLFFTLLTVIVGLSDENYFSVVATLAIGFVCLLLYQEIKKIHERSHLVTYQKSIATNGFDASLFAFFVFAKNGKCVFVNRVAQNLFSGFKIRTIEDFIFCLGQYPKVIEAVQSLQVAVGNAKQSHIDVPMKLNSEKTALWRIAVSPIPEHSGFSGWSIIDLTPSTMKIESPETNSHFLLNLINGSTVGYFCLNEKGEIIFCNETFSQWLGCSVADLTNGVISQYVIGGKSDSLPSGDGGKFAASMPAKITLQSKSNEEFAVIVQHIFQDKENNNAYLVTRDPQQGGDIIQALGKTKLYFEHIFEDAPVGIAITDGAETINACNRTFQQIVGEDSVDNSSFFDYILDEERELIREKFYNLLEEVNQSIDPFEIHFKANGERTIMVYVTKIDEAKRTRENDGLVMYLIDVTERKELQQQFVQSQKMQAVGQLAGGIAHDFNNLLTAMIGYCDLLLEKYLPSDQSFNDVMQIKQNANRASNLVRQLLAFSRQQTLQPKILGITDMIGELSTLLKRLLGAKVELKVIHGKDIGFIKVDQIQFEQVIINLAVNARDAMQDGGILTIQTSPFVSKEPKLLRGSTMPPGDYVLIEVIDNGSGIEEQNLHRIFDPFFSSKEKGHGTGLGLSTVYGIVNQTGGFISVESAVGSGTKFSLYFPRVFPTDQDSKEVNEKSSDGKIVDLTGTGTILLVEDEDAVRMFSSRALRDKGYKVIESSNGESALEFIQKGIDDIDLIITDVVMPKMDGPTLMKHIKVHNPKMKVIFISGYTEDSFRDSLANNNSAHFLPKPFNLKELASKVKEVLG